VPVRGEHGVWRAGILALAVGLAIAGLREYPGRHVSAATTNQALSPAARLGRAIFFDQTLSASGRQSCASCHDAAHAYGPPNALAVQLGGPRLDRQGVRAVPSLRYVIARTPRFAIPHAANPIENLTDNEAVPTGGFAWDGRFDTPHDQVAGPFLDPNEMANASPRDLSAKLERATYAGAFRDVYGDGVFADPQRAIEGAGAAIERFELEDPSFHPYSSKFDRYLNHTATLTAQELQGKRLFDDPRRGGCALCHLDARGADGSHPIFTDFQFEVLGVPRNPEIRANARAAYDDLGLCGPLRRNLRDPKFCGMFKTPSLRNVATRHTFFHNGRYHTLKDALRFYVQRDTNPERFYPRDSHGRLVTFDDVPVRLRGNIDHTDAPLTLKPGEKPVWSDAEIDAVAAFLSTLTDEPGGSLVDRHAVQRRGIDRVDVDQRNDLFFGLQTKPGDRVARTRERGFRR
jgi:cytochrome c peroxidase